VSGFAMRLSLQGRVVAGGKGWFLRGHCVGNGVLVR
jgi:hypothetical protein